MGKRRRHRRRELSDRGSSVQLESANHHCAQRRISSMFTGQILGRFGHLLAAGDDFVSKVREVVPSEVISVLFWLSLGLFVLLFVAWLAVRYVPNDRAAIVEKLWS